MSETKPDPAEATPRPARKTLSDDDVVTTRSKSARSVVAIRGAMETAPSPNDPSRKGVGHGDADH